MKLSYLKYSILNNIFIITISLILLLLSINIHYIFIVYILFQIYIYKQEKIVFITSIIISIIVLIIYIVIKLNQNILINNYPNFIEGKVINIEKKEYYQKITIKYKIYKIIINDYDFIKLKIGDIINVTGNNLQIDTNHIPNGFNYKNYFYNNLYLYQIKAENIKIIKHQFSIYIINDYLKKYFDYFFEGQALTIIKGFILGDTSGFSDNLNNDLKTNGIIHLFAISGSHIVLIVSILDKLLNKIKYKNKIINVFLIFYLIITKFSISITRAVLTFILNQFLKYKQIKISSIDTSSIIFIILIILNPFIMYNIGFVLSFISTFIILLASNFLKKINNIKSILFITLLINLFTFPIIINMNNEFNILSPIINIIMILIVEGIIMPISFLVAVFPIFNIGYTYIISGFIKLNEIISDISYKSGLVIIVGTISYFVIIVYYFLIFSLIIIKYKKNSLKNIIKILILMLASSITLILTNITYTNTPIITFLDLYNGESTLIQYKNEIILIDTGEGINNEVTSFLKSKDINKIDYLILTHNHSDHNGEAKNIINTFKVTNIVISSYDNSEFAYYNNIVKINKDMILKTKYLEFLCLSPSSKNNNENNNSLVLYTKIKNISFLFTGDIEKEIEDNIINIKVDVLKIAHHGSNTSSSIAFLKKVNPSYAIIMSGRSNIFEFPSDETLNNLKKLNIKTYCTKDNYSIVLKIKENKCIFKPVKEIINLSIKSRNTFGEYIF